MKTTRNRTMTVLTLAALSALVLLSFSGEVQAAPVTLLNPGFELGPATNSPPTHWATNGGAVAVEKSYDGAPFGNWSMGVKPGGQAVQTTNHTIAANDVYTLSFHSAQTNDPNGDINAIFLADNGGTLTPLAATIATGIAPGLKNWQPYQAELDFPNAAFAGQKLAIGFGNVSPGNNWVGADEVSLDAGVGVPPDPADFSFFEDFNSYSGNQNNTQYQTGLPVAHSGTVSEWTKSGAGAIHAVKLTSAPDDWAIMFFRDNVITSGLMAANASGLTYDVEFDYGTAVYHTDGASQATTAADGLVVDVLRADNSVLATGTYMPGAWSNPANANLSAALHGLLTYTGDGTGDVKIRVRSLNDIAGRFGGEIDNLSVSVQPSEVIPEPCTMAMLGLAFAGLGGYVRRRRKA